MCCTVTWRCVSSYNLRISQSKREMAPTQATPVAALLLFFYKVIVTSSTIRIFTSSHTFIFRGPMIFLVIFKASQWWHKTVKYLGDLVATRALEAGSAPMVTWRSRAASSNPSTDISKWWWCSWCWYIGFRALLAIVTWACASVPVLVPVCQPQEPLQHGLLAKISGPACALLNICFFNSSHTKISEWCGAYIILNGKLYNYSLIWFTLWLSCLYHHPRIVFGHLPTTWLSHFSSGSTNIEHKRQHHHSLSVLKSYQIWWMANKIFRPLLEQISEDIGNP